MKLSNSTNKSYICSVEANKIKYMHIKLDRVEEI